MKATNMAAIILVVLGILEVYAGASFTSEPRDSTQGSLELTLMDQQQSNNPLWAGAGAIMAGGILLVMGGKKSC